MGMSVGEEKKAELEPKDAFGERNPELARVMHLSDFRKRDMDPYPGMQVDIDGTVATVKSINSGRVLVDANHPLAGERMIYEVKLIPEFILFASQGISYAHDRIHYRGICRLYYRNVFPGYLMRYFNV